MKNITKIDKFSLFILYIFFIEGFLAKSFLFNGNDPTILHYSLSSVIIMITLLLVLIYRGGHLINNFTIILLIFIFTWLTISTLYIGDNQNYLALPTFLILIFGCFYGIPSLGTISDNNILRILYFTLAFFSLSSIMLWVVTPDLSFDPDSGRFSGTLISVAVACNVFFYFSVIACAAMSVSTDMRARIIHGSLMFIGLGLLYFTKTRSSLVEALACIGILLIGFRFRRVNAAKGWFGPVLIGLLMTLGITALGFGAVDTQSQLEEFRLSDQSLDTSRGGNWEFGIERIIAAPLFGEGLLTKQTQGGSGTINIESGANYDPRYDPHSLILSFAVQAGIPFAIGMMGLLLSSLGYFLWVFGLRKSIETPEFVLCAVHTLAMIPAGGDLTSFGNSIDRIFWVLLGCVVLKAHIARTQISRYPHLAARSYRRLHQNEQRLAR